MGRLAFADTETRGVASANGADPAVHGYVLSQRDRPLRTVILRRVRNLVPRPSGYSWSPGIGLGAVLPVAHTRPQGILLGRNPAGQPTKHAWCAAVECSQTG